MQFSRQLLTISKLSVVALIIVITGCSSQYKKASNNDYFHQQDSFNIALISLHKISIVGLIDRTQTLTPKEKQKYSQYIFNAFANQVDSENLIATKSFAQQIGIANYQNLVHAAKENNIDKISELANKIPDANRYILLSYLTSKTDYGSQQAWQNCNHYGYSAGLTMKIIDTQTNSFVWDGHVDKNSRVNVCDDNDDDIFSLNNDDRDNDKNEAKSFLALAFIGLVLDAISEERAQKSFASNDFDTVFKQSLNSLSKRLPSFYH